MASLATGTAEFQFIQTFFVDHTFQALLKQIPSLSRLYPAANFTTPTFSFSFSFPYFLV